MLLAAGTATAAGEVSPMARLARELQTAGASERVDFAAVALEEMHAAYRAEADALRRELMRLPDRRSGLRWLSATTAYAERLRSLAEGLSSETPVRVIPGPAAQVQLLVDGALVIVEGPRIGQPDRLERQVVERYCRRHPCRLEASLPPPERAPTSAPPRARDGLWSFGEGHGPVLTTEDGLEFRFARAAELKRKREIGAHVVGELRALARALQRARAYGIPVDWETFEVVLLAGEREQVVLNRDGEYLLLRLPMLAGAPALLRQARPWLRARAQGRSHHQTFANAERLIADLSVPP